MPSHLLWTDTEILIFAHLWEWECTTIKPGLVLCCECVDKDGIIGGIPSIIPELAVACVLVLDRTVLWRLVGECCCGECPVGYDRFTPVPGLPEVLPVGVVAVEVLLGGEVPLPPPLGLDVPLPALPRVFVAVLRLLLRPGTFWYCVAADDVPSGDIIDAGNWYYSCVDTQNYAFLSHHRIEVVIYHSIHKPEEIENMR